MADYYEIWQADAKWYADDYILNKQNCTQFH